MLKYLNDIDFSLLHGSRRGIERETLRINQDGSLAKTGHPKGVGEKLTNDSITVDFSEELLEFITPPYTNKTPCLQFLSDITSFTLKQMPTDEIIWSASMPPHASEDEIRIADFGHNNSAMMKQVYRKGLANRYNKIMQIISGIHYNFSPSEAFLQQLPGYETHTSLERKNSLYFRLINKFHRSSWSLMYLFGASPICSKTSVHKKPDYLKKLDDDHYIGEYATSLRMSDLGYQSDAQESLFISCKNINTYVVDLLKATYTPYKPYQEMGIQDKHGNYKQLNDCILQIENEYYSSIRPKQIAHLGERPACALLRRGVEYVEVRLLDIDPFAPLGIDPITADFVEVFLVTAMMSDREYFSDEAMLEARHNFSLVTKYGRKPNLKLLRHGKETYLKEWLDVILSDCLEVANHIDRSNSDTHYTQAVQQQIVKMNDVNQTPSAQVIQQVANSGVSYQQWMLDQSRQHSEYLRNQTINADILSQLKQQARQSRTQWEYLEKHKDNEGSFADYLRLYYDNIC